MNTVNLNFKIVNMEGKPTGAIAGPVVAQQMNAYIVRMEREGEQEILAAMQKAQEQASINPYTLDLTDDEFGYAYSWLTDFSGFYGESLTQLKNAFSN